MSGYTKLPETPGEYRSNYSRGYLFVALSAILVVLTIIVLTIVSLPGDSNKDLNTIMLVVHFVHVGLAGMAFWIASGQSPLSLVWLLAISASITAVGEAVIVAIRLGIVLMRGNTVLTDIVLWIYLALDILFTLVAAMYVLWLAGTHLAKDKGAVTEAEDADGNDKPSYAKMQAKMPNPHATKIMPPSMRQRKPM